MIGLVTRKGGEVLLCGACVDARGISVEEMVEGCRRSNMDELTVLTLDKEKVLIF